MARGSEQRRQTPLRAIGILAVVLGLLGVTLPREAHASPNLPVPQLQTTSMLYLPLVFSNQPELESGLEVTQSVQQPDNPVLLIDGRSTFVRYAVMSETEEANVSAHLMGSRGGTPLPGSPLAAMNNPRTLKADVNRSVLSDTFNFELPTSWTSGTIVLQGSAANGGSFTTLGAPATLSFHANAPLAVTIVPISYTCTSGGSGTVTPSGPFGYMDDWPFKLYPVPEVDLATHGAVSYSGPCTNSLPTPEYSNSGPNDWTQMLNLVSSVWTSEGSPNRYYYGLVEIDCGGSCVSGLGWVGGLKAAVGWNGWNSSHTGASGTMAHEIGHNHGLPHAPGCGAGNPDPYYPYGGGLIGDGANPNFGFDVTNLSIKPYGSTYDFMTYCSTVWVSDYNYAKLYAWEQAQPSVALAAAAATQDALLVSGIVDGDGLVHIMPAYRLDLALSPPAEGDLTLELLGEGGQVLAAYPFQAFTSQEDNLGDALSYEQQGFQLAVPYLPGIEKLRVTKGGRVLGELVARGASTEMALAPRSAGVEGGMLNAEWSATPGLSFMLRLSDDGGNSWRIVALDLKSPDLRLPVSPAASAELRLEVLASDGIHTERLQVDLPDTTE